MKNLLGLGVVALSISLSGCNQTTSSLSKNSGNTPEQSGYLAGTDPDSEKNLNTQSYKTGVAKKNSNVRSGPSTSEPRLFLLVKGSKMIILEEQEKWLRIEADIENSAVTGWIYAPLVEISEPSDDSYLVEDTVSGNQEGITTANSNVREGPGTQHKKIGFLVKDSKMRILGVEGEWLRIEMDTDSGTQLGWIHAELVDQIDSSFLPFGESWAKKGDAESKECIPSKTGQDLSFIDKAKTEILSKMIDLAASEILELESPQIPEKIDDTCEAKKRLDFVNIVSEKLSRSAAEAVAEVATCYGLHEQAKQINAMLANSQEETDFEYINDVSKEIEKELAVNKSEQHHRCAAGAIGSLKGLARYGSLVVAWDKKLIDFSKDNVAWAFDNMDQINTMIGNAKDISTGFVTIGRGIVQPLWTQLDGYDSAKAKKEEEKAFNDMAKTDISKEIGDAEL